MKTLVHYASDSGSASIWLNLSKLLVGLTLSSVIVLSTELGYDPLTEKPALLTTKCPMCESLWQSETQQSGKGGRSGTAGSDSAQSITSKDDVFTVSFVPIVPESCTAMALKFDKAKFLDASTKAWREKDVNTVEGSRDISKYLGTSGPHSVRIETFSLASVFGKPAGQADTGEYCLRYRVSFTIRGKQVEASEHGTIYIKCQAIPVHQYGDLPIVQGQYCAFPWELREKTLTNKNGEGRVRRKNHTQVLPAEHYSITMTNDHRFKATTMPYSPQIEDNYYEMDVQYNDENGETVDCTVSFVVQKNQEPRPITESDEVPIYYPRNAYDTYSPPIEQDQYRYFDLDMFIIDPDGAGTVRPMSITLADQQEVNNALRSGRLKPEQVPIHSDNYTPVESGPLRDNGRVIQQKMWRLKINDYTKVALGGRDFVVLKVSDGYQFRLIPVRILSAECPK